MTRREFMKLVAASTLGVVAASKMPLEATKAFANGKEDTAYGMYRTGNGEVNNQIVDIVAPQDTIRYEIIDNHLHFVDFIGKTDGLSTLCKAMDVSGVKKAVLFGLPIAKQWDSNMVEPPSYYLSNDSRCYYYSATDFILAEELLASKKEIRERFFPFCCGFNCNDKFAADYLLQILNIYPKFWSGVGEIMSRHDDLTALTYGEAPHADGAGFQGIYDVAAEKGLTVLLHHNITGQNTEKILYLDELKRALAYNRKCKIIWAHVGISRRVEVKNLIKIADELLLNNKNLWIDISWIVYDYYFLDKFPNNFYDGNSLTDWVNLIEKHPDRFLLGTDKVGHFATYPAEIVKYYKLLDKLKPKTAENLCKNNIMMLVKKY